MRARSLMALAQLGLIFLLTQGSGAAAEIRVLSLPGFRAVMDELGPQFERTTGHTLNIQYGLPGQLKETLDAGEFDVRIASSAIVDSEINLARVVPSTRSDIGRSVIGVAVRAGAPKPDISSVAAFKQALLSAKSISYTNDSGTGIYLAGPDGTPRNRPADETENKADGGWGPKSSGCCRRRGGDRHFPDQ